MEVVKSTHIQLPMGNIYIYIDRQIDRQIPSVSAVSIPCVNNNGENSLKFRVNPLDKDVLLNKSSLEELINMCTLTVD